MHIIQPKQNNKMLILYDFFELVEKILVFDRSFVGRRMEICIYITYFFIVIND